MRGGFATQNDTFKEQWRRANHSQTRFASRAAYCSAKRFTGLVVMVKPSICSGPASPSFDARQTAPMDDENFIGS
jgi:hypothetical protein